jgi:phosphatidylglycerophosphatase A
LELLRPWSTLQIRITAFDARTVIFSRILCVNYVGYLLSDDSRFVVFDEFSAAFVERALIGKKYGRCAFDVISY